MGGCNFRKILPINLPKHNGGIFQVFWRQTFKNYVNLQSTPWAIHFHHRHCGSHKYAYSKEEQPQRNRIAVKVSRRSQKVVIILANDTSGLAFCSTDLGNIFGNNVGNQFGLLMKRKSPQEPQFAYDIGRIHSLMIYSDLVEYSIVGDTKAPVLRCFPFVSKLKGGDIIINGQYMNYQTFSNLQFRPLLRNSFHGIHIDLTAKRVEEIPFVSVGITRLGFDVPKSFQDSFLIKRTLQDGRFKTSRDSIL